MNVKHSMGMIVLVCVLLIAGCSQKSVSSVETSEEASDVEVHETPRTQAPEKWTTNHPSPEEFVAYSLNAAREKISGVNAKQDYRVVHPEVYSLGGINHIHGLVYDRETGGVILVGRYDSTRQPLTLDDFVVALRARFIHNAWPLVSIDITEETKQTGMQVVRFEGGIEDTQFGADLLDADYRLKRIEMGLLPAGIPRFKSGWDMQIEAVKELTARNYKFSRRFWFYPVSPNVSARQDVVAIQGLKVSLFTEILSAVIDGEAMEDPTAFQDKAGVRFVQAFTERFGELAQVHPSFSRLRGLDGVHLVIEPKTTIRGLTCHSGEENDSLHLHMWWMVTPYISYI